jgi:group I intron endonuclease
VKYYVYIYTHPETRVPFYVGKGTGMRMYKHLSETYGNTENKKKYAVIKSIRNKGMEPIVEKVIDGVSEETAYDVEAHLIASYGRLGIDQDGILTNICVDNRPPCSKGIKRTAKQKEHASKVKRGALNPMYGKKATAEHRLKNSLARRGENNHFYGKKHSEETRTQMAEKARKRTIKKGKNPVRTPHGVFQTLAEFSKKYNLTEKMARGMFEPLTITARKVRNNPLLNESHIGKTYQEAGYEYI